MPEKTLETVIWCPRCALEKYEVWRVPADNPGVYQHITVPASIPPAALKVCECGTNLVRKT